jgi:hypothetical protein
MKQHETNNFWIWEEPNPLVVSAYLKRIPLTHHVLFSTGWIVLKAQDFQNTQSDPGWWLTYPSEKYECQFG